MNETTYTLADELDRKTLDALATLLRDVEDGAISRTEADYALRILFQAVSGLVSSEAFDLMSRVSKELEGFERYLLRRIFVRGQEVVLIQYQYGEARVSIKRGSIPTAGDPGPILWGTEKAATFEHEINPFETAHQRFQGYSDVLLRQGFNEVK